MEPLLNYALDGNGVLVHVDNVAKGKACGCFCPSCKKPLYAKHGRKRMHHFAHAFDHDCKGAYETVLHLLAKEVLQEVGQIMLPLSTNDGFPSGLVKLTNLEIEKWDERYRIKPDVEGILENGERLLVEFLVSHRVDEKKRQVIIDNHLKCVEIDINYQALDKADLREFLTNSKEDREWVRPLQIVPKKEERLTYPSTRNPVYGQARDILKSIYDQKTLLLHPYLEYPDNYSMFGSDTTIDLRELGYDVCEVHTKYRGFKSDLLLSKSQEEGKGNHISINVRGRRRSDRFKRPKGLFIIDIVLKYGSTVDDIKGRWKNAVIAENYGTKVIYTGFEEWVSREHRMPKVFLNENSTPLQ